MIAVAGGAGIAVIMKAQPPMEEALQPPEKEDDITTESYGCAFNIAIGLARRGYDVSMGTLVGNDMPGLAVIEGLRAEGVDTAYVKTAEGASPIKVEILNVLGDPEFFRVNETMHHKMDPDFAEGWTDLLEEAEVIVLDGSLPEDTIGCIAGEYGGADGKKIFFDPAGIEGAAKAAKVLDKLYCVMPGRIEAETMTGMTILSEEQLAEAGRFLAEKGVDRIFITMKGGGLYYKAGGSEGIYRPDRVLSFTRTAGAGDVVSAAVIAADLEGKSVEETAAYAMEAAADFLSERKDEKFI